MSRKGQHNSETLGLEYFPPDVDNIDTGDLRGLLGSNEPISNVLSIPHPPQTKRWKFENLFFWPFLRVHDTRIKMSKVNSKDFAHKRKK